MILFDTDVLVEILKGTDQYVEAAKVHADQNQVVPIVVIEEIYRGRLNAIRRAESSPTAMSVDRAYGWFEQTIRDFQHRPIASFTKGAQKQFEEWRQQKVRVATHDLRIAAICVVNQATLISRNRRDFDRVPGLAVEYWG